MTVSTGLRLAKLKEETIETLASRRTVLTVTHRLETMQAADRILVLADGRIAEQGSYAALSAAGGFFSRMVTGTERWVSI